VQKDNVISNLLLCSIIANIDSVPIKERVVNFKVGGFHVAVIISQCSISQSISKVWQV